MLYRLLQLLSKRIEAIIQDKVVACVNEEKLFTCYLFQ